MILLTRQQARLLEVLLQACSAAACLGTCCAHLFCLTAAGDNSHQQSHPATDATPHPAADYAAALMPVAHTQHPQPHTRAYRCWNLVLLLKANCSQPCSACAAQLRDNQRRDSHSAKLNREDWTSSKVQAVHLQDIYRVGVRSSAPSTVSRL